MAENGAPERRGDVAGAAVLAEGAARAAALLVRVNLTMAPNDDRILRANGAAVAAAESAQTAVAAVG